MSEQPTAFCHGFAHNLHNPKVQPVTLHSLRTALPLLVTIVLAACATESDPSVSTPRPSSATTSTAEPSATSELAKTAVSASPPPGVIPLVATVAATATSTPAPLPTATSLPPTATTAPAPSATATLAPQPTCDANYSGACIPVYPPDINCTDISAKKFQVTGTDVHGLDNDGDGVACES